MDGASVNISIKSAADLKAVRDANAAIRQSAGGIGELNKAVSILTKGMGGLGDIVRGVFTGGLWSIGASLIKGAFDLIKGKIDENREQLENYRRSAVQSLDGMAKAANSYRIAVSGVAAAQRAAADAGLERATKELDLTERLTKATIELARQKRIAAGEDAAKVNAESDQAASAAADASARGKADAEIEAIRKRIEIAKNEKAEARGEIKRLKEIRGNLHAWYEYEDPEQQKKSKGLHRTVTGKINEARAQAEGADERIKKEEAALAAALKGREALEKEIEAKALKGANEKAAIEKESAKKAADERLKAETAAAQEAAKERERLERQLHQQRMADLKEEQTKLNEQATGLSARATAAQSEFDRAFAMYRDPSRAAAEIDEEKDYRADLDRLHKDARRYGGKWRIDELSALMSRGDSQGVSDTLAQWRKSKSFTPEVEAMVRASAAEQTKTTAEDELRKLNDKTSSLASDIKTLTETISTEKSDLSAINGNTANLSNKLDELLSVK